MLIAHHRHGVPEVVHHTSMAAHGDRVLLLGSGSLRVLTGMAWQV